MSTEPQDFDAIRFEGVLHLKDNRIEWSIFDPNRRRAAIKLSALGAYFDKRDRSCFQGGKDYILNQFISALEGLREKKQS